MSNIKLVILDKKYKKQCEEYKKIMLENGSGMDGSGSLKNTDVDAWIEESEMYRKGINLPEGRVPATQFVAIDESENVVGMLQVRHNINTPYLSKYGGHIGYSVRVDERRKGYAKEMLKQALVWCRNFGLNKVLITCKKENIASAKTILANGGVFESEAQNGELTMLRFWIEIK